MNRSNLFLLTILFLGISFFSCSTNEKQAHDSTQHKTEIDSLTINDTINFNISSLKSYPVKIRGYYEFPLIEQSNRVSPKLVNLYTKVILERDDSISVKSAIESFNNDVILTVKNLFTDTVEAKNDNQRHTLQQINIRITQSYNAHNVICFCKDIFYTTQNNNTIISKSYFTFDTENAKYISIDDLIPNTQTEKLIETLKNKLIEREHVSDSNDLMDMGYFNIENMNVQNFYLTDNGITFVFEPYEIACYALGEISIDLSFSELAPLLNENSIISDLI